MEKAKKENKYIILKREDVYNYFSQFSGGVFATDKEEKYMKKVPFGDVISECEKQNTNKYIIINQDEPYAELIWQIILMGEDAKHDNNIINKLKLEKKHIINEDSPDFQAGFEKGLNFMSSKIIGHAKFIISSFTDVKNIVNKHEVKK